MDKYDLLHFLYVWTDRRPFSPMHSVVRKIYQGPLRSFVKSRLAASLGPRSFELVIRHSTATGSGFDLFGSDLDCTIILDGAFSLKDADKIRDQYSRIKKSLPMLGEIEIFSKSEWACLQQILQENGELLQLLRDLKKVRWMEWKLKDPAHPYHTIKAKRAIRRVLEKYESAIPSAIPSMNELPTEGNHRFFGKGLTQAFRRLVPVSEVIESMSPEQTSGLPKSFSLYSREIHVTVGCGDKENAVLSLDPQTALCLLSLYPSHEDDDASVLKNLNLLRQTPQLRSLYIAVMVHDLIYANASPRVHVQYRDTSWQWTESLIRQLKAVLSDQKLKTILAALNYHPSGENGFLEVPLKNREPVRV